MRVHTARHLGAAIKGNRLTQGLTQQELATRAGVSRQWIIAVEAGKSTAEIGAILRTIAALGLTVDIAELTEPLHGDIDLDHLPH